MQKSKKNVFITGATSALGLIVIRKLLEQEAFSITCLVRNRIVAKEKLPQSVNILEGDLANADKINLSGFDVLVHIASITPVYALEKNLYQNINIDATSLLLKESNKTKINQFVYISSAVVNFVENTDSYTASKRKAEELIINSGVNYTIIRPVAIMGPNVDWMNNIKQLKQKQNVFVYGHRTAFRQFVFIEDVANIIVKSIANADFKNKIINVSNTNAIPYYQVLKVIRKELNLKYKIINIPHVFFKILMKFKILLNKNICKKLSSIVAFNKNLIIFSGTEKTLVKEFEYTCEESISRFCKTII